MGVLPQASSTLRDAVSALVIVHCIVVPYSFPAGCREKTFCHAERSEASLAGVESLIKGFFASLRMTAGKILSSTQLRPSARVPVQRTEPPQIHQRQPQDNDENQNFPIPGPAKLATGYGPGIDEHRFQIENHKENRYEIKLHRKAHARRA